MAHDVFLSYSMRDREAAEAICRALEAGAVRVWMAPRNIVGGATWPESIPRAIEDSKAVVLLFSKHADASEWVPREIQIALDRRKKIIPFRIVNAEPTKSLELFVKTLHWIDGFPGPLERRLPELTRQTQMIVGVHPPRHAPPPAPVAKPAKPEAPPISRPGRPVSPFVIVGGFSAAAAGALALAVVVFGGSADNSATTQSLTQTARTSIPSAADCPAATGNKLMAATESEAVLPGQEILPGMPTVLDVRTLSVRGEIVKLAGVGNGPASSAALLREWLAETGPTVSCTPTNLQRCEYVCENEYHADIGKHVLAKGWASASSP